MSETKTETPKGAYQLACELVDSHPSVQGESISFKAGYFGAAYANLLVTLAYLFNEEAYEAVRQNFDDSRDGQMLDQLRAQVLARRAEMRREREAKEMIHEA